MKKVNFAETVEEGVALVGLAAWLEEGLISQGLKAGTDHSLSDLHTELVRSWQDYVESPTDQRRLYSIFNRCREIINPIQSILQNWINDDLKKKILNGYTAAAFPHVTLAPTPDQVLKAIVRVKEVWAYIDSHPQTVLNQVTGPVTRH